jgi:O-antigen/teichoic acid export membrane protein
MTKTISQVRSYNYLRQIRVSAVFKVLAIGCSFLSMPLMLHYLGQEQFGVWSTLLSVVMWITFFDLGLGNGLRNRLAESLAKSRADEARNYVSSAYSLIGLISLTLFILLAIASFAVPWQIVFNTKLLTAKQLSHVVLLTGFFIALNFWLGLINTVLNAVQKTSVTIVGQFLVNALSLALVYVLTKVTDASVLYLSLTYGIATVGTNVLLTCWFYKGNPSLTPRLALDFLHIRPLIGLGLQFFVIQIAMLVIFTTDKILIVQFFGPKFVAQYDVVFKLFGIITLTYGLITAPLWSAYSDAYHRADNAWIKSMLRKQLGLFVFVLIAIGIVIAIAKPTIAIWIGHNFEVSMHLIVTMGVFVLVSAWNSIFGTILGAINKIRLGAYYTVLTAALNIPVSYLLAVKFQFGLAGILMGTIASISISAIISPLQVYYFIYSRQENKFLSRLLK